MTANRTTARDFYLLCLIVQDMEWPYYAAQTTGEAVKLLTPEDRVRLLNACMSEEPVAGQHTLAELDKELTERFILGKAAAEPKNGKAYRKAGSEDDHHYFVYVRNQLYDTADWTVVEFSDEFREVGWSCWVVEELQGKLTEEVAEKRRVLERLEAILKALGEHLRNVETNS